LSASRRHNAVHPQVLDYLPVMIIVMEQRLPELGDTTGSLLWRGNNVFERFTNEARKGTAASLQRRQQWLRSGPFQRSDDIFGFDGWKALAPLGESYFDLLFNRAVEEFDVIGCGQTVLANAFQVAADGGIAFGHQARQSRATGNVAAFFSRFKKYRVTAFGHSPVLIVEWSR
jgi:hypothetical protein